MRWLASVPFFALRLLDTSRDKLSALTVASPGMDIMIHFIPRANDMAELNAKFTFSLTSKDCLISPCWLFMPIAMTSCMMSISIFARMRLGVRPRLLCSFRLMSLTLLLAVHDPANSKKGYQGANKRANNDKYFRRSVHVSFRLSIAAIGAIWSASSDV